MSAASRMLTVAEAQLNAMVGVNADLGAQHIEPPSDGAKELARKVLTVADTVEFVPQYVTPSADGGVVICFSRGETYADIECFNNGEVWALIAQQSSEPKAWPVSIGTDNEIASAIQEIQSSVCVNA